MNDRISGARARVDHEPYKHENSNEWKEGYHEMEALLSPIETEILLATIRFKVAAETKLHLMGCENADSDAPASTLPSERSESPPTTG